VHPHPEQVRELPVRTPVGRPFPRRPKADSQRKSIQVKVILATTGSLGDVAPFVRMGAVLQNRRGHSVTMLGNGYFAGLAEQHGLELTPLYSARYYEDMLARQAWRGWKAVLSWSDHVVEMIAPVFEGIARHRIPGDTVVVAHSWLFGARVAREVFGLPLATVHLQPLYLRRDPASLSRAAGLRRRIAYTLLDRMADRAFAGPVNDLLQSQGLGRVSGILGRWWNSPDLVLGFFPEWFAPREPGWPDPLVSAGFPLLEAKVHDEQRAPMEQFLASGPPPLVFAEASFERDSRTYFETAVETALALGRRALLITSNAAQLPEDIPGSIAHLPFVPYDRLLRRSAALVHHGGTGTAGAALAAGVPQLTVPDAPDQKDNSRRLRSLGVAETIRPACFGVKRAADALRRLTDSPAVRERCRHYAGLSAADRPFQTACDAVEALNADPGATPRE